MKITGPFPDKRKKRRGQPNCWYLRYSIPRTNGDGTAVLKSDGKPVLQRYRPYYKSKAKAEADKPRIIAQHSTAGAGTFLFDRQAAGEYESALKIAGGVPISELARFWRLHHPETPGENCAALLERYIHESKKLLGILTKEGAEEKTTRHLSDLQSRVGAFLEAGFGSRFPETVIQRQVLDYLLGLENFEPRTVRNHKNSLSIFFGWIRDQQLISSSPLTGIKKRMLPQELPKEIGFLSLTETERYLRALERYAPEMVAHEVVQLISGVRADDEMADFRAEFVLPQTKEIKIPAAIAKTGKREVINTLEKSFWSWWAAYGPRNGLLRPSNCDPRWYRVRVLTSIHDQAQADKLALLPIKTLLKLPAAKKALKQWPWNGRRRTFCTFHIAMHQSADRTALILRHRGSAETLHNSYRGTGVTEEEGRAYFNILPVPVAKPILPQIEPKGIIRIQIERKLWSAGKSAQNETQRI